MKWEKTAYKAPTPYTRRRKMQTSHSSLTDDFYRAKCDSTVTSIVQCSSAKLALISFVLFLRNWNCPKGVILCLVAKECWQRTGVGSATSPSGETQHLSVLNRILLEKCSEIFYETPQFSEDSHPSLQVIFVIFRQKHSQALLDRWFKKLCFEINKQFLLYIYNFTGRECTWSIMWM